MKRGFSRKRGASRAAFLPEALKGHELALVLRLGEAASLLPESQQRGAESFLGEHYLFHFQGPWR